MIIFITHNVPIWNCLVEIFQEYCAQGKNSERTSTKQMVQYHIYMSRQHLLLFRQLYKGLDDVTQGYDYNKHRDSKIIFGLRIHYCIIIPWIWQIANRHSSDYIQSCNSQIQYINHKDHILKSFKIVHFFGGYLIKYIKGFQEQNIIYNKYQSLIIFLNRFLQFTYYKLCEMNKVQAEAQTQQPQYIPKSVSITNDPVYLHSFSLYCSRRGKHTVHQNQTYSKNIVPICTFSTLQQFFQYFLSIKKPSQCLIDSKILLFHQNCKPFWQEWLDSGCLILTFKNKPEQEKFLDAIWEFLCYMLIGSGLDSEVIGIAMGKRQKITLLQIWLRKNTRAVQIGLTIQKQILTQLAHLGKDLQKLLKIKHKKHCDSINTNSTIKGAHNLTQVDLRHYLNNTF